MSVFVHYFVLIDVNFCTTMVASFMRMRIHKTETTDPEHQILFQCGLKLKAGGFRGDFLGTFFFFFKWRCI